MRIAILAGLAVLVAAGLYTGLTWQANPGAEEAAAAPAPEPGPVVADAQGAGAGDGAGGAAAAPAATAGDIAALRTGDMEKLAVHSEPRPGSAVAFTSEEGGEMTLAAYEGQVVVLNFWATWCAPCRAEMPTLEALQREMGGDGIAVVTVATGRNPPQAMARFFDEVGVESLPLHRDARQALARDMGVLGLPMTLILDRQGREVARLTGEADWSSESAKAILAAFAARG